MASMQNDHQYTTEQKASGLSVGDELSRSSTRRDDKGGHTGRRMKQDGVLVGRSSRWRVLVVDIALLLALVLVGLGIYAGYRALKQVYDPAWESKTVEFCIKIEGVDRNTVYDEESGRLTFKDKDVYHTDLVEGDYLGIVSDVDSRPDEDGQTVTLYLTVKGEALYRKGKGYYMGETRLLANMIGQFRVQGMTYEGLVISLHEVA